MRETDEELDAAAAYEKKPIEEIRAELQAFGIDPAPTVKAVKALIKDALRGLDHLETVLAFMFSPIPWTAAPAVRQP